VKLTVEWLEFHYVAICIGETGDQATSRHTTTDQIAEREQLQ